MDPISAQIAEALNIKWQEPPNKKRKPQECSMPSVPPNVIIQRTHSAADDLENSKRDLFPL